MHFNSLVIGIIWCFLCVRSDWCKSLFSFTFFWSEEAETCRNEGVFWEGLLLVWTAGFWVSDSPSGQFPTSARCLYRAQSNNNCMLWAVQPSFLHLSMDTQQWGQPAKTQVGVMWEGVCVCVRVWSSWVIATCWETRLVWFRPHVFSTEREKKKKQGCKTSTKKKTHVEGTCLQNGKIDYSLSGMRTKDVFFNI